MHTQDVYAFTRERELNIASRSSYGCSINGFELYPNDDPNDEILLTTEAQVMEMLNIGRCHYYLLHLDVLNYWRSQYHVNLRNSRVVETFALRLRLNKRHESLLVPINAKLRALKNSGELAALIQKHLKRAPL